MVDIYLRNPEPYIIEAMMLGATHFSWDTGDFTQRNINPIKFFSLFAGVTRPWTLLTVAIEGASEYDKFSKSLDELRAVYPSWRFEYGYDRLRDYCENPVGLDPKMYEDETIEQRFRPVKGQKHKILIYDSPNLNDAIGVNYLRQLRKFMQEFPNVEFILHNSNSYRLAFGFDFAGMCMDPYMTAKLGSITTPAGRAIGQPEFEKFQSWIHLLGYSIAQLKAGRDARVEYNIRSLFWAKEYYKKNVNFRLSVMNNVDFESPDAQFQIESLSNIYLATKATRRDVAANGGDGIICGACSLALKCKFFRVGAVCSVPGSTSADLASMFGTRDASVIIDGLLELTKVQATRVKMDLEEEEDTGTRLPQTDKRIKDLFDAGVKVAKLVDPSLNGKRDVNVNVGVLGGAQIVAQSTPQELMSRAVAALEARGIPRSEITPEMIGGLLEGIANRGAIERVIEGELA